MKEPVLATMLAIIWIVGFFLFATIIFRTKYQIKKGKTKDDYNGRTGPRCGA